MCLVYTVVLELIEILCFKGSRDIQLLLGLTCLGVYGTRLPITERRGVVNSPCVLIKRKDIAATKQLATHQW